MLGSKLGCALVTVLALVAVTGAANAPQVAPSAVTEAATSASTTLTVGVKFATEDGVTLRLDSCRPSGTKAHPTLVIVPGGGFTERTRDDLRPECTEGAENGFSTFVVDYRLATEGSKRSTHYPAQVRDVQRAFGWITAEKQAKRFHDEPKNAVLLGESAGAIIASEIAVGTHGATLARSTFKGVALLSGVYDFTRSDLSSYLTGVAKDYVGCTPSAKSCAASKTASAARYVKKGDPQMLLVGSTAELVSEVQIEEFDSKLTKAKVTHKLMIASGDYHAIDIPRHDAAIDDAMWAWLKARTKA